MSHSIAEWLVALISGYVIVGTLFAVPFVTHGINRLDPLAAAAPWTFRVLVAPGTVVFWPLLLVRWLTVSMAPPVEINPHRLRARRWKDSPASARRPCRAASVLGAAAGHLVRHPGPRGAVMSHAYRAVGWNTHKQAYDALAGGATLACAAVIAGGTLWLQPSVTAETGCRRPRRGAAARGRRGDGGATAAAGGEV